MDSIQAALFTEGLKTEAKMQARMLATLDLPEKIPEIDRYKSSSIAAQPFKKHMVQETKAFKPQITKDNFERAKKSFGMCTSELMYREARKDLRPKSQCFRTGREGEQQMKMPPDALRQKEYYGKPDATAKFYRGSGAFAAVEERV